MDVGHVGGPTQQSGKVSHPFGISLTMTLPDELLNPFEGVGYSEHELNQASAAVKFATNAMNYTNYE